MGAVIFARRYEGWADFGADGDPELLLDEIELLRSPRWAFPRPFGRRRVVITKETMMPLERRNEPQMLRQFQKTYPSYNLNPLLRKRHQQLVEAQALNEWLANRRLQQEGEAYAEIGRMTEAVNRRIPQLRYAPAGRQGVHRMARDVAAGRNSTRGKRS